MLLQLQDRDYVARICPSRDGDLISVLLLKANNNYMVAGTPIMLGDVAMLAEVMRDTEFLYSVANDLCERYKFCSDSCSNVKNYSYCEFDSPEYVFGAV